MTNLWRKTRKLQTVALLFLAEVHIKYRKVWTKTHVYKLGTHYVTFFHLDHFHRIFLYSNPRTTRFHRCPTVCESCWLPHTTGRSPTLWKRWGLRDVSKKFTLRVSKIKSLQIYHYYSDGDFLLHVTIYSDAWESVYPLEFSVFLIKYDLKLDKGKATKQMR